MQDFKGHQKNQGNITTLKDHNNFLVTDPKEMENWDLPDKVFKTIVLKKLSELQENTDN